MMTVTTSSQSFLCNPYSDGLIKGSILSVASRGKISRYRLEWRKRKKRVEATWGLQTGDLLLP